MQYSKPALTINDQLDQLENRGLLINDRNFAYNFLENVSYYRLAGYWWSLQSDKINHIFKPKSDFQTVANLYNFDKDLRALVFNYIEKIEISLRTRMIYQLSTQHNPNWFEDSSLFQNQADFKSNLDIIDDELKRCKEVFIKEHFKKYDSFSTKTPQFNRPPAWKTIEIISMGHLSRLYGNLKNNLKVKNDIPDAFLVPNHTFFSSWLQSISLIRNFCAHHSRLWNKTLVTTPRLPTRPKGRWIKNLPNSYSVQKLYPVLCCMRYLLNSIDPSNNFTDELQALCAKYPNIDIKAMGFDISWTNEPLWN
ncbi:Abi family protein [Flectobacillus roseus]|uniref:Abi family protein n=1 Tax=Flectobacillus roseus TaxID=502259 RepID=A0ABT6Y7U3_9BACT|nr:Abi family protein [Flectobacillus roseus]MDI9859628.1 Abi family protein [Flectobacillus roseus]